MTLHAGTDSTSPLQGGASVRPARALLLGTALSILVAVWGPYNCTVLTGPEMTCDFTTAAAVFLMFFMSFFVNGLLRRFLPRCAFSSGELFIAYAMAAISCSICTMGITRGVTLGPYSKADGGPIMSFVQFGALMALVGNTLWIARGSLRRLLRAAINLEEEAHERVDLLTRSLLFQVMLGMLLMTGWFRAVGVPWWASVAFVVAATATFLGLTRILCESGLALLRNGSGGERPEADRIRQKEGDRLLGNDPGGPSGVHGFDRGGPAFRLPERRQQCQLMVLLQWTEPQSCASAAPARCGRCAPPSWG